MPEDTSFARLMEKAGKQGTARLRAGEIVNTTVIQIAEDFVFVDVGTPSDGRIARSELLDSSGKVKVRVGDSVQATVVDPRPDGPLLAVAFGHSDKLDLGTLDLAQKSGAPIEAEVTKVVKGGLEVQVGGARAFCPASQMELSHVADFTPYVGQRFEFKVLEIRDGGRSIVLSRRALLEDRRREAAEGARSRLVVGSEVEGTVQSLGRHGAVIDLEGVEGFIHLSELAAHRVERAEDAVKLGERVRARVLSVEDSPKGLRVRLSLRALQAPPEAGAPGAPAGTPPDEVLVGQVTRVLQHGIVVQTPRGEGLIPLRELGLAPGADHRRAYPPGKQLDVVIVSQAGGCLTFSATQVARVEERKNYREFSTAAAPSNPTTLGSLGDVLRGKLKSPGSENAPGPGAPKTEAPGPNVRRRR
jgi:small subunit ribosomal protein S1